MLNRISNIAAGSDFKSSAKQNKTQKYGRTAIFHIYDGHDSINISPAYNFLIRHNWKIKELNIEDEKVTISFSLAGFDFFVIIPLKQINQITNIVYTVAREKEMDETRSIISVDFLVNLSKINYNEDEFQFLLTKLETFFNRLNSFKLTGEITASDRQAIEGLLDGLAQGIQSEFESINNCLFIFIEKYFNIKISGWSNKSFSDNSVFITRIRPFTQNL